MRLFLWDLLERKGRVRHGSRAQSAKRRAQRCGCSLHGHEKVEGLERPVYRGGAACGGIFIVLRRRTGWPHISFLGIGVHWYSTHTSFFNELHWRSNISFLGRPRKETLPKKRNRRPILLGLALRMLLDPHPAQWEWLETRGAREACP